MKNIVLFATDDFGGAGKAAVRILNSLNRGGNNCKLLVKNKQTSNDNVIRVYKNTKPSFKERLRNRVLDKINTKEQIITDKKYYFAHEHSDLISNDISHFIDFVPDTIIITWISLFLSPLVVREVADRFDAIIVVYPMDMSLFTGGCHYAWSCEGYKADCHNCPAITNTQFKNLASDSLSEKKHYWGGKDVDFWACSSTVESELLESSLLGDRDVRKVYIPIDEKVFNINNLKIAKDIFGIKPDEKVILFGSSFSFEERKGIDFFFEAINLLFSTLLETHSNKVKIIVAGRKGQDKALQKIPFDVIDIDFIGDDRLLSLLYQASDVLVCPSIQDSGPMMINEAQMCGLPTVAFKVGVAQDFISNGVTGYVCDIGNASQLAEGVGKVLFDSALFDRSLISLNAKNKTSYKAFNLICQQ